MKDNVLKRFGVVLTTLLTLAGIALATPAQAAPAAPRDPLTASQKTCAEVQLRLASLGYYRGRVDAKCGPLSRRALQDWRDEEHIQRTGPLTSADYNTLRGDTLHDNYSVVVSLSAQTITFYVDGRAFYRDHVSTGKDGERTETEVIVQYKGWHRSHRGWQYYPSAFMESDTALQGCLVVPPAGHSTLGDVCLVMPLGYAQYKLLQEGMKISIVKSAQRRE